MKTYAQVCLERAELVMRLEKALEFLHSVHKPRTHSYDAEIDGLEITKLIEELERPLE